MKIVVKHIIQGFFNWFWYSVYPPYKKKQEKLFTKRNDTCEACERFYKPTRQCMACGCFVDAKTKVIYELDSEGYSILERDESGDVYYACPEKKW